MLFHLRIIGFLEGLSYILLMGVCMPLKYFYETPEPTRIVGMAHGILFVYFCLLVLVMAKLESWNWKKTFLALLSSLVPFGTFVADVKLFKVNESNTTQD